MPKLKKDDPQFPERSGGSFLKTAVAATPLTIGVAAAIRGVATDGSLKQPREAGIDQAMRHLAQRAYKGPRIPSIEEVNRFMSGKPEGLVTDAWKWAASSVDKYSRERMRNLTEGLEFMTEAEARSAITQTVTGNESAAMSRIWRKFQNNVELLHTQQIMYGTLPTFTNVENLTAFAKRRTIPLTTPMPEAFATRIQNIAESLGAEYIPYGFTRPEVAKEGFGVWNIVFKGGRVGDFELQLPQVVEGVMLEGSDLQTRRIAPDVVRIGPKWEQIERIGRTEFFLREFEESIVPDIKGGRLRSQRDVEKAVKQLKTRLFGELEAVPNIVAEGRTISQASREALRGKAVDVVMAEEIRRGEFEYQPGFRRPEVEEVTRLMASPEGRAMKLVGGVGPKGLSQGRLSTAEWERFTIGSPEWGRRPEQVHREYQATQATMKALRQNKISDKYRAIEAVGKDIAYENVVRPKLKTIYINPKMHGALLEELAMDEGEGIIRSETASLIQFEESAFPAKLAQAREDISDFGKFKGGEILGVTPEGKPFVLPKGSTITNVRPLTDETFQVAYMRTHQLKHGEKIFDAGKIVLLERGGKEFTEIEKRLGLRNTGAELYANMDELRKNRALHRRQIVNSLEDIVTGNWMESSGKRWAKQASHQEFIQKAMGAAMSDFELTRTQFAEVFGAVPFVLEDKQAAARLVREAAVEAGVSSKIAHKMTTAMLGAGIAGARMAISYGGPRVDVGGLGSLEPRAFEILTGGAFGTEGRSIAAELAGRLAATAPEKFIAHEEIRKTLASISGSKVDLKGKSKYMGEKFQQFLEKGGGYISPGRGMKDIYVPGADVMQQLRPFETAPGVTVHGKISDIYSDIAYKTELFKKERLTAQEYQKEVEQAADLLRKEWAPAGKGAGAISRGKIIGSRFLRGVSAMEGGVKTAIREADVIGVTKGTFSEMYKELLSSQEFTKEEMQQLRNIKARFLAGQDVGGLAGRHPITEDFSIQPTKIRMVKGSDDLVVFPVLQQKVNIRTPGSRKFSEEILTLGHLPGMRGDKDADPYFVTIVGPKNEEHIRERLLASNSEYRQRYAEHQIRTQIFKPKKAPASKGLTTIGEMIANVEKLSVGQEWIGRLSNEMSDAKKALSMYGRGTSAADARFLLGWLENVPIGAKHMKTEEAGGGGMKSLMESILSGIQQRNEVRLESNIASIVKDDATAKAMLTGNVYLDKASAEGLSRNLNIKMQQDLRGVNVPGALKELMRVLSESDASGATRQMKLLAGRGAEVKINEMVELTAKTAFKRVAESSMFSRISSAMVAASNTLGQAGRGILKHHKAIGFGFAGSLALSAALSSPTETVGSGSSKIPNARLQMNRRKAADRMKPEDMQPPQQSVGRPTAPQLVRNQTVRLSMNQPRTSAHIRARVNSNMDAVSLGSQLSSMTGNSSVNLRDNRAAALHPREIANKLL